MRHKRTPLIAALVAVFAIPFAAVAASTQERDEGNGKQYGTTPDQKLAFHGSAPVAQRANSNAGYAGAATGTLTFAGNPAAADTVTIGATVYTVKTTLTGAANEILRGTTADFTVLNLVKAVDAQSGAGKYYGVGTVINASAFASAGATVAASSTLTSNNTNVTVADTVTIGTKVYTFVTTPTVEGDVARSGTNADGSLLNLIRAINHSGTAGTDYFCAAANAQVTAATSVTSHAFLITAITAGASANTIATTTVNAGTTLSWTGATLASGTSAVNVVAKAAGTAGNSVATTETSSVLSFGASTLGSGTATPSATQDAVLVNELRDALIEKGIIKGGP